MQNTLIVLLVAPLALCAFAGFWCAISFLIALFGGWRRLALSYASDEPPTGTHFGWQSGYVGLVSYRNCLNVTVSSTGIFVSPLWMFRPGHRALYIPWTSIHDLVPSNFLSLHYTRFEVGVPTIARMQLSTRVFDARRDTT